MSTKPPTLLLIDVQQAFDDPGWGERNNPGAELQIARLLAAWRAARAPIVHVRHRSASLDGLFRPGTAEFEYKPEAIPGEGEAELVKEVNSAFIGTDLQARLEREGAEAIVIAGLTTDHCCSTTARMAANLGFETAIVSDATATFERSLPDGRRFAAELVHDTALASLAGEFAAVLTADEALALLPPYEHSALCVPRTQIQATSVSSSRPD